MIYVKMDSRYRGPWPERAGTIEGRAHSAHGRCKGQPHRYFRQVLRHVLTDSGRFRPAGFPNRLISRHLLLVEISTRKKFIPSPVLTVIGIRTNGCLL
jgi:hypothetical protein